MNGKTHKIIAQHDSERLDKFLAESLPGLSRSRARFLINRAMVTLNGNPTKPHHGVSRGQIIVVTIPSEKDNAPVPEEMPVDFIYKDDCIAVLNKPPGLVVHPAAGNESGTLVNALLFHLGGLPCEGQENRPGIVHRLDKDTSGLMIVARTEESLRFLQAEFAQRRIEKEYLAITVGVPGQQSGTIKHAIGRHETKRKKMAVKEDGRDAVTDYRVVEIFPHYALVQARPKTGRTHQIRVHFRSMRTPVLCDSKYSGKSSIVASELLGQKKRKNEKPVLERQALHASRLSFRHPESRHPLSFEAPLPGDIQGVLDILRSGVKRNT